MKRLFLFILILTLSLATLAEARTPGAQSKAGSWDFSIQTRYSWGMDVTSDDGSSVNFEDDLGWGFGFSKYLSDNFNLGMSFAWHSIYYTAHAIREDGQETASFGNVLDTSNFAIYGDYTFGTGRFKPYVTGNLGWALVNTNIIADLGGYCWYYPFVGLVCSVYPTSTYGNDAFTYGMGLGLRMDLNPKTFLKVGWDHTWADLGSYEGNDVLRIDLGFLL